VYAEWVKAEEGWGEGGGAGEKEGLGIMGGAGGGWQRWHREEGGEVGEGCPVPFPPGKAK
jgi:hypothetical protein